jgi:L-2-hydroxyglutarate oxidase
MSGILTKETKLFLKNSFGFRSLAIDEVRKYSRRYFTSLAASMVHELDVKGFTDRGKPGIRAQLLDLTTDELLMDFIIEGDKDSIHILNAVSPAFTCAFTFAKHVVENYVL